MINQQNLGSDRDPVGVLFKFDGHILRGIRPQYAGFFRSVLSAKQFEINAGIKIIETSLSKREFPDYPLVLEHREIDAVSYGYEWPLVMLRDAALLTIDLCLEFVDSGWVLKDATPWNILFDGPKPLWVDVASIMPQETNLLWVAYDQFCRSFLFPLLVGEAMSGSVSRALLLYQNNGIDSEEILHYLPAFEWTRHPWLINRLYLPRLLVTLLQKSGQAGSFRANSQKATFTTQARSSFFESIKRDVLSINAGPRQSRWANYYLDIQKFFDVSQYDAKQIRIAKILEEIKPSTVVDIGSNQGGYAIIAALRGARVTAFDTDEESVSKLYQLAKEKHLSILPLVGDVLHPSPRSGWRAIEYPSAPDRFRSQLAMALALVHHLAITQIQTFERIVQTLSEYCDTWLITEFVPIDDVRSQELLLTNRRDLSWYTLENFLQALMREFSSVECFPSYPEGRTLCFCRK